MKKFFGIALLLALVGCGSVEPEGSVVQDQKCDPRNPDTCVGSPDSTPCGAYHQICCGINGWAYDCTSSSNVCNPNSYTCVSQWVPCVVHCYNYWTSQDYWLNRSFSGSASKSDTDTLALQVCSQLPLAPPYGWPATLIGYSCTY